MKFLLHQPFQVSISRQIQLEQPTLQAILHLQKELPTIGASKHPKQDVQPQLHGLAHLPPKPTQAVAEAQQPI